MHRLENGCNLSSRKVTMDFQWWGGLLKGFSREMRTNATSPTFMAVGLVVVVWVLSYLVARAVARRMKRGILQSLILRAFPVLGVLAILPLAYKIMFGPM